MTLKRKAFGQQGENQAKKLLQNKGYKFIAQNFHCHYGEIDLIFQDKDQIVFVEVKARTSDNLGLPEEAVDQKKIDKITTTGHLFLQQHPNLPQFARIDLVAIDSDRITHYQNISQ